MVIMTSARALDVNREVFNLLRVFLRLLQGTKHPCQSIIFDLHDHRYRLQLRQMLALQMHTRSPRL